MRLVLTSFRLGRVLLVTALVCASVAMFTLRARTASPSGTTMCLAQSTSEQQSTPVPLFEQSQAEVNQKSDGCVSCHTSTDSATMHTTGTVRLGCTDCHGGHAEISLPAGVLPGTPEYVSLTKQAHPKPRIPENAWNSANPVRAYTKWLKEDADYIKFINPGDLRVADETCGRAGCHVQEVRRVQTSMMTHGAMLWGAALYNNGAFPLKDPHFGESYSRDGRSATPADLSSAHRGRDAEQGHTSVSGAAGALGGIAAGQRPARL